MKANLFQFVVAVAMSLVALLAPPARADDAKSVDIKRAAPADAYLAVYVRHNPERDYQRQYFAEAWKTFQDEHICERLMNIASSHAPQDKLAEATSRAQELAAALAPIDVEALANADEFVMAEVMQGPASQFLIAVRLKPQAAADCERGMVQTFELISRWSNKMVTVDTSRVKDTGITTLALPKESPFQPAIARLNDIVLIGTDVGMLCRSIEQLQDGAAKSKFDDPRLQEALTHLPKPEDSLVFFDGRKLFEGLHGIGGFIRSQSKNDETSARVARAIDRLIDEAAVLDYEATVETTEPGQNRKVSFGKLSENFEGKLLGHVFAQAKPFENWQSWVPKDATAFSLSTGASLHELYDGIIKFVREEYPESKDVLDTFAALQTQFGVNLDLDILQSFPGETVSITVPVKGADGSTRQESVVAMKCVNSDKIRGLLARAVASLNSIPAVQMQQLKLEDCKDLAGFQTLNSAIFVMIGAQPVIGFSDGWMIISSSREAAEKLLAVRSGKAESIDAAARFEKLGLDPKGPVNSVSYQDIGAGVRQAADLLDKVGAMAPMFLGMAAANVRPEDLKPVQEVIGLLPSAAKVIRKFDFFEHNLTVTRAGPQPGTYLKESVTEIRIPK